MLLRLNRESSETAQQKRKDADLEEGEKLYKQNQGLASLRSLSQSAQRRHYASAKSHLVHLNCLTSKLAWVVDLLLLVFTYSLADVTMLC